MTKEEMLSDLLSQCRKIDLEIGGKELANMPVPCAKLIVGLKKRIQDYDAKLSLT